MITNRKMQTIIEAIVKRLITEYKPEKVILYGSYANGTPDRDSDIDLLIVKETSSRLLDRWVEVQSLITDLHRSVPVDTLVLTPTEINRRLTVGDQFVADILTRGEVLYVA